MTRVEFNKIFDSFVNSDFGFDYMEEMSAGSGGKNYLNLTSDIISSEVMNQIDVFMETVGISQENYPSNFGVYVFEGIAPVRGCLGYIGMGEFHDTDETTTYKPCLKIGNDVGADSKSINILITAEEVEITKGRSKTTTTTKKYFIGDAELEISPIYDKEDKTKIIANYGVVTSHDGEYTFVIPFMVDPDVETGNDFYKAFNEFRLDEVLRKFGTGSGNRIWGYANKLFLDLFHESPLNNGWNNPIYENGIALLCRNGKTKFIEKGAFDGAFKSDSYSITWDIVKTSHPDALVRNYVKKEYTIVKLEDVTNIQFPNSAPKTNEAYHTVTRRINTIDDCYPGLALIIIRNPNRNREHIPHNTCTLIDPQNPRSIKKAKYELSRIMDTESVKVFNTIIEEFINNSAHTINEVSEEDARKSLEASDGWLQATPGDDDELPDDEEDLSDAELTVF